LIQQRKSIHKMAGIIRIITAAPAAGKEEGMRILSGQANGRDINNLVLDMGNVLLGWTPRDFALRAAGSVEDAGLLCGALFDSPDWALHDAGQVDEDTLLRRAQERLPVRLHRQLGELIANWPAWMAPVPGVDEITRRAKQAGYRLYLLSNAGARFPGALRDRPFYPRFEGMMVSYHERIAKPDVRLYRRLCERFCLAPGECLFVDDVEVNVCGAIEAGMQAHHFTGDWQPVIVKLGLQ
jgi:putative hydrolase of the HAD superfamily